MSTFLFCLVVCSHLFLFVQGKYDTTTSTRFLRRQEQEQEDSSIFVKKYKILSSEEIYNKLIEFSNKYPNFAKLTTSQEKYGLAKAGGPNDCPFDRSNGDDGCNNYILTIQDYITHGSSGSNNNNNNNNKKSNIELPEVLWSGALHGNERIGPTSVVEATELLLESVSCEAKPNKQTIINIEKEYEDDQAKKEELIQNEYDEAIQCREILNKKGINKTHRQWLSRLVTTRRLVVVPNGNALGYYQNTRTEGRIDPNRDFPYDILPKDSDKCMQTIAGRTFNEIFREHIFQLSLTFHAGMEVISYEWGAPSWYGYLSPDHVGQSLIAKSYSSYANGWNTVHPYNTGTMNDLVYYVRGGMEDWAYAGSVTPSKVIQCTPKTFNGYDVEKTSYDNTTLRTFNMLIETSNSKTPTSGTLGTSHNVLYSNTDSNGHISRNIRLALLSLELVEPYISIISIGGGSTSPSADSDNTIVLSDDIVPMQGPSSSSNEGGEGQDNNNINHCDNVKTVIIPNNMKNEELIVNWTVGGSLEIDETSLLYGKWDDIVNYCSSHSIDIPNFDCLSQPLDNIDHDGLLIDELIQANIIHTGIPITDMYGKGYFAKDGPQPKQGDVNDDDNDITIGPVFSSKIILSKYQSNDKIIILGKVRVDQSWKDQPKNVQPNIPPQSHVVNARTNPNWYHEKKLSSTSNNIGDGDSTTSTTKVVKGRLDWYTTIPLTVIIGEYDDTIENNNNGREGFIELSNRFGYSGNHDNNNGDDIDEGY